MTSDALPSPPGWEDQGRIALDEVLDRFPDWEVDTDAAVLDMSAVRGWKTLPATIG